MTEDLKLKMECLLRRAGLSRVPKQVLLCTGVVLALLLGFAVWRFWPSGSAVPVGDDFEVVAESASGEIAEATGTVTVDVEGAVKKPGMYQLAAGSRVGDAIEAAGGMSKKAAKGSVNLAEKIEDSQQITVPRKSSSSQPANEDSTEPQASSASSSSAGAQESSGKININTASAEELQALSGIGEAISQRIVDYREANGAFSTVDDLTNVSGIGDARLAAIRDQICV